MIQNYGDILQKKVFKAEYEFLKTGKTVLGEKLKPHQYFKKNPNLKRSGLGNDSLPVTAEQIIELNICSNDPIYFINKYCYIVNLDDGLIQFKTRDYQDELITRIHKNNRVIVKFPRQSGKTVSTAAYAVWQLIFRPFSAIAILANKAKTAIGILQKVRLLYENLPHWIQIGVKEWNKGSVELENNSRIEASATSSSAIRSMSISTLIIDECAFVEKGIWSDFFASVYPTVSSSKKAKIILISTPNGMNHFYKFWEDAVKGRSDFVPYEIEWDAIPGRDEQFKSKVVSEFGVEYWNQEFACEFLGSAGTLISGSKLKTLVWDDEYELKLNEKLKIFKHPIKANDDDVLHDSKYVGVFDTGEGVGLDYSTLHILNVDSKPYEQVAVYKDNDISIRDFPIIVDKICKTYNNALIIGENNTIGAAVLDDLFYDLEYENLFFSIVKRRKNNTIDEVNDERFGIRMTPASKKIGCSNLKTNIEDDHFKLNDYNTIQELTWFIKQGDTYKAEEGRHDDLITPLVIFSYFLRRREWVEMWLDQSKDTLSGDAIKQIEEDLLPIGFVCDDGENIVNLGETSDFF